MFLLRKIKTLREKGHFAALAYCEEIGGKVGEYLKIYLENKEIYKISYDFKSIQPLIRSLNINIVHAVEGHPNFLKEAKRLNPNIVCVTTQTASIWDAEKKFDHQCYTNAIVTMADSFAGVIRKEITKLPKIIQVIENGVDINEFSPVIISLDERNKLDAELGKVLRKKVVMQVGRIHPIKNIEDSLKIAQKIIATDKEVIFLHVGGHRDAAHENYYRELAEERKRLRLEKNYFFLGEREDVRQLLRITDCVLSTTKAHEGTPNALLEAMSMEKPIVAFNCLGISDVVHNGINGFLISDHFVEKAAEKVKFLLGNSMVSRKMGKKARKLVYKSFSLTRAVTAYENLYKKLLARTNRRLFKKIVNGLIFLKNSFCYFFSKSS